MRIEKIVRLGTTVNGTVFCRINFVDGKLSISGVEGPFGSGDCRGSCGQIVMSLRADHFRSFAPGWDAESVTRFFELWERWHLNDMRAGCEHQRKAWDVSREIEVVAYGLTHDARRLRESTLKDAASAALRGETFAPDATARALAELTTWFMDVHQSPDADSPLSGCYEVKKREMKAVGWVTEQEHSLGVLCKPCSCCGYKYGSAWLHEDVPLDVLRELRDLLETDVQPAWV